MSKRTLVLICSIFLIVPLLFMGCGSDGSDGAKGAKGDTGDTGATGATGPAGAVTNTNESCMVCHTKDRIADIKDTVGGMHYAPANSLPNLTVGITNVTANGSGNLVVSFNVKIDNNAAYTKLSSASSYFFAADLVPAGTVAAALDGAPQSTAQFERWAFERTGTYGSRNFKGDTLFVGDYAFGTFDNTDAANGNYTYTFATPLGSTTPYDNALLFSAADIQRVWVRVAGTPSGYYTGGVGFMDFTLSGTAPGYTVTNLGYLARQFVTIEACQKCHGPKNQVMDHGSSYMDISGCVICHSPIINANNGGGGDALKTNFFMVDLWLGKMIHRIHDGKGSSLTNKPQADAVFPQDIRNCVACHSNPSGKDLGAGDQLANWKNHPTAAYCGSCHTGANFVTGVGHAGGAVGDNTCSTCHPPSGVGFGMSVTAAHDPTPTGMNAPEFDVKIVTSTVPALGYFSAGDNLTITVTLKKHSDGTDVPGTVYTAAKDAAGNAGGGLNIANLYVYGPRALPKPIFAPTDNTQGHGLFVGTVDTSGTIATDNTGFKYQFTIPAGVKAGTYAIWADFADFGGVAVDNYVTGSNGLLTFQVGSTTVEKKVAGDSCTNCHGTSTMHLTGTHAHNAAFDTDICNACHDYSGGYAANLSNRVHAVHSANTFGDMKNTLAMQTTSGGFITTVARDWSDIGYPQSISNCSACHSSTIGAANTAPNTSYRSVVSEITCLGCHGDNIYIPGTSTNPGGATNHMLQSGGDWPKP